MKMFLYMRKIIIYCIDYITRKYFEGIGSYTILFMHFYYKKNFFVIFFTFKYLCVFSISKRET